MKKLYISGLLLSFACSPVATVPDDIANLPKPISSEYSIHPSLAPTGTELTSGPNQKTSEEVVYLDGSQSVVTTVYADRPELGWPIHFDEQRKQFLMFGRKKITEETLNDFFLYYSDLSNLNSNHHRRDFSLVGEKAFHFHIRPWDDQQLIAVSGNSPLDRIFFLDLFGNITPVYQSTQRGFRDGSLSAALFNYLETFLVDKKHNIYVYDSDNYRLRKIDLDNRQVSTFVGSGNISFRAPEKDGFGQDASIRVTDMSMDQIGDIYVLQGGSKDGLPKAAIRKITSEGFITTLEYTDPDKILFKSLGIPLNNPSCILHHKGVLYLCDTDNNLIRSLGPDGILRIVAGAGLKQANPYEDYIVDGIVQCLDPEISHLPAYSHPNCFRDGHALNEARFNRPTELFVDDQDNLYVIDSANGALRKITFAKEQAK